jgi:protein-disulfide isomerase
VALVYIDFPLSSHGYPAIVSAEAAHCAAAEDRYWDMHDALFENFADLSSLDIEDETAAIEAVHAIGAEIGLDAEALRTCLDERRYRPVVAALQQEALSRGVELTPTLLIGERPVLGFVSFEDLQPVIETEYERAYARSLGTEVPTYTPPPPEPTPTPAP